MMLLESAVHAGILLPPTLLDEPWIAALATFVTINTMIYLVIGMVKILPQVRWRSRRAGNRRAESRSIHPNG